MESLELSRNPEFFIKAFDLQSFIKFWRVSLCLRTAFRLAGDCLLLYIMSALLRSFLAFLYPYSFTLYFFLDLSVTLKKLDADAVTMLTNKLFINYASRFFIRKRANKLGKVIPVGTLGSEMRCMTSVFTTQFFYFNFNGLVSGFNFFIFLCFNSEVVNFMRENEISGAFARVVVI